jgi:hypothetical protein
MMGVMVVGELHGGESLASWVGKAREMRGMEGRRDMTVCTDVNPKIDTQPPALRNWTHFEESFLTGFTRWARFTRCLLECLPDIQIKADRLPF